MALPTLAPSHRACSVNVWPHILRSLAAIVVLAYPALVYFGMSAGSPRRVALVLLLAMTPALILRLRKSARQAIRGLVAVPLTILSILLLAAALDGSSYIRATPVATNIVLLIAFGGTLRRRGWLARADHVPDVMPMIERFARLQEPELTVEQQAWCRLWTWIWCGFFVLNGSIALVLAIWGTMKWWALYNGLFCYGLSGSLFAIEWTLRRRRFPHLKNKRTPENGAEPTSIGDESAATEGMQP